MEKTIKITLMRHGRPDFELKGKVRAGDLNKITEGYNQSGIADVPPASTKVMASDQPIIVCSDLNRSVASANKLGITDIYRSDPLFREVELPHFTSGFLRLDVTTWVIICRLLSVFGYSNNGESLYMAKQRTRQATQALIDLANAQGDVLLIGHGFTNILIAKELLNRNWQGPKSPGRDFWSFTEYTFLPGN